MVSIAEMQNGKDEEPGVYGILTSCWLSKRCRMTVEAYPLSHECQGHKKVLEDCKACARAGHMLQHWDAKDGKCPLHINMFENWIIKNTCLTPDLSNFECVRVCVFRNLMSTDVFTHLKLYLTSELFLCAFFAGEVTAVPPWLHRHGLAVPAGPRGQLPNGHG